MDYSSVDIIDVHCHIDHTFDNIRVTFEMMDAIHREDRLRYLLMISPEYERAASKARPHHDRIGILLWYDPRRIDSLRKVIKTYPDVVKGIKFLPNPDQYHVNIADLQHVFDIAEEYGLLVTMHTDENAPSSLWVPIIEKYSTLDFILYHGFPHDQTADILERYENTYVDTSYTALNREFLTGIVERVGSRRILFGIDSPIAFPIVDGGYRSKYRSFVRDEFALMFDNDDTVLNNILHLNAKRILRLP